MMPGELDRMDVETGYLVYAALYRLAVIAAGIVCVVLGYRLFLRGVSGGGEGTSAEAKAGSFELSLSNAAPGTCFALFGAALIVAMVVEAQPSFSSSAGEGGGRTLAMKGRAANPDWQRAERLAGGDNPSEAIAVYGGLAASKDATARDIARVADGMAKIYLKLDRKLEALAMARLAVQVDAQNPGFLRTLANAAGANGLTEEEAVARKRAAR